MLHHFSTAVSLFDHRRLGGLLVGVSFCKFFLFSFCSFIALKLDFRSSCLVYSVLFWGVFALIFVVTSLSLSSAGTYFEFPCSFDYVKICMCWFSKSRFLLLFPYAV